MEKLLARIIVVFIAFILSFCFSLTACTTGDTNNSDNDEQAQDNSDGGEQSSDGGSNEVYYTVTFDSQGGSEVESQSVLSGNPARRPDTPTREGYSLTGWFTDVASENQWDFYTDRVTGNITLYAGWQAEDVVTPTESLLYERDGDTYIVTGIGDETAVVIPAEYNGLPVVAIRGEYGTGAFARTGIVSVVIPDSITEIGQNTFNNCSQLVSVRINITSSLTTIGRNAFSGCSLLESIYIPAGVTEIGDSAFNNCGSLESVTVADGNGVYRSENGHLIESDSNTLIRGGYNNVIPDSVTAIAQAAFRRSAGITQLYIPLTVTTIGNYIIADSTITEVLYEGTEEQWNAIEKSDSMWNYGNRDVTVTYSASIPTQDENNILVVYFSNTGNTQGIAEMIAQETGATLWEIEAAIPYTADDLDYSNSSCRANVEQNDSTARPAIADTVENFDDYQTVFIGYPIWWSYSPRIIQTFIESYDFTDKTVYVFSTSASSSGSSAYGRLTTLYTSVNFGGNLHLTSLQLSSAQTRVSSWLNDLDFAG